MTNSLLGILLRFRKDKVAATADVEQMFYRFRVREDHRDYLRFFWYRDNDVDKDLIEYRMKVHVFGNTSSPAVATYGLRRAVQHADEDVKRFVNRDFYVDDALTSKPEATQTIELMKKTQSTLLEEGHIRLHKIASNSLLVMSSFPTRDLGNNSKSLELGSDEDCCLHRSLGVSWDILKDVLTFRISDDVKPFTRRGILSTVNSLYDPIGFVAPVVIKGKLLLRDLVSRNYDWDDELPFDRQREWVEWRESLKSLDSIEIPRQYLPVSPENATRIELHVYCDASEKAIAASAYIVCKALKGEDRSSFVMGKAKVAPTSGHTIPRLELCAAVLAVETTSTILEQIDINFDQVKYFSDSKVVLGYINNKTKRFYTYVSNRVEKIRSSSCPEQWNYVPTHLNPADCATRGVAAINMVQSQWLKGPSQMHLEEDSDFPLVNPELDKEIHVNVAASKVTCAEQNIERSMLETERFERFSSWASIKRAISFLQRRVNVVSSQLSSKPDEEILDFTRQDRAESLILRSVQIEAYSEEYQCLDAGKSIPKKSAIATLNPFIDAKGVLRVDGRLERSDWTSYEKHPAIVPKKHHIATLLVRHYHEHVKHQGRHLTEGALRSSGYWIVGAKRLISSIIHSCVQCRKLRGKHAQQIMSDLPQDRLEPAPPFTYVGVDAFGPWNVTARRTRGGKANSKRWGILFTCLTIRAIHIEVVEEMSASAFMNALRRFIAQHGNVKLFRSDRGTNFVGATKDLNVNVINVEDGCVNNLLKQKGVLWVFNPPHASHMGGAWERMIGVVRRILDSILSEASCKTLTHDVLTTVMAEVCAIVNARPIVPISTDSSEPEVLSPSSILTQKADFSTPDFENMSLTDIYRAEWKRVQVLADRFWKRWKNDYLQSLQPRRKWQQEVEDIHVGDVVLVKDVEVIRNQWPLGIVEEVFPSKDGRVRKLSVRMRREMKNVVLTRPISEIVLLLCNE
ncbi:uncharacterized protein LOC128558339 [Mercenaria mercenaria]|uniref:uncharacterized protein LOC128558339 n=1 Tax=Mercenaria mercenaria TaxID=6596 RepID=UPI00234F2CB1|nr:uncharacterized protein LOC128558339 [Mercenaria mercenaria]